VVVELLFKETDRWEKYVWQVGMIVLQTAKGFDTYQRSDSFGGLFFGCRLSGQHIPAPGKAHVTAMALPAANQQMVPVWHLPHSLRVPNAGKTWISRHICVKISMLQVFGCRFMS
jgi:hypothetical protein